MRNFRLSGWGAAGSPCVRVSCELARRRRSLCAPTTPPPRPRPAAPAPSRLRPGCRAGAAWTGLPPVTAGAGSSTVCLPRPRCPRAGLQEGELAGAVRRAVSAPVCSVAPRFRGLAKRGRARLPAGVAVTSRVGTLRFLGFVLFGDRELLYFVSGNAVNRMTSSVSKDCQCARAMRK